MTTTATHQTVSLQDQILEIAMQRPEAYPLCYETLGGLANQEDLLNALDQLSTEEKVIELRGEAAYFLTYVEPELNNLICPPTVTEAVEKLAEIRGETLVFPSVAAANCLGLTNQCLNKVLYMTDGESRISKFGNLDVIYDKAEPWELLFLNTMSGYAIRAIDFLGRYKADKDAAHKVQQAVTRSAWEDVLSVVDQLPEEMQASIRRVV